MSRTSQHDIATSRSSSDGLWCNRIRWGSFWCSGSRSDRFCGDRFWRLDVLECLDLSLSCADFGEGIVTLGGDLVEFVLDVF
jgi:hypothetical protein